MSTSINPIVSPPTTFPASLLRSPLVDQSGLVTWVWTKFFQSLPTNVKTPQLLQGTHASRASRLAGSYVDGSIFVETDRKLAYLAIAGSWIYFAGIVAVTQDSIPKDLTATDFGVLCFVTDFAHLLQWSGTAWQWAPGELGSDMVVAFVSGPTTLGWQACDGSANIPQLNADGSLGLVTVPNIAGSWYRQ